MIHRTQIQCLSCDSVILVRVQMGYLHKHPIRVYCGQCKILIYGEYNHDVDLTTDDVFKFDNAIQVYNQKSDYYIDVSGEFLTSKIQKYSDGVEYSSGFSPYMTNFRRMIDSTTGDIKMLDFVHSYTWFLQFIDEDWPFIRRIHELWLSGNHHMLDKQLQDMLPVNSHPLGNNFERFRSIHLLTLRSFKHMLPKNFYDDIAISIGDVFMNTETSALLKLSEFYKDNDLYNKYNGRFFKIFTSFISIYPSIIPVLSLDFMVDKPNLHDLGLSSVEFDDVKNFYEDCFECIGELSIIPVTCNNMVYRQDYTIMAESVFPKIKTIHDFKGMRSKGNKLKFLEPNETFNNILSMQLTNNKLRNAITHGDYTYDGVNQLITYNTSDNITDCIYLSEFIQESIKQFQTILVLFEMFYRINVQSLMLSDFDLVSNDMMNHGFYEDFLRENFDLPANNQSKRKQGRNERCLCGSGLKYKKCCLSKDKSL